MENILTKEIVWLRLAVKVYDRYNDVMINFLERKKMKKQVINRLIVKYFWSINETKIDSGSERNRQGREIKKQPWTK